jgi:hypothetical protein
MMPQSIIQRTHDSGQVQWTDELIEWQKPDGSTVTINLKEVAVIGEYATDAGLVSDDWFFVFVYRSGNWESVSVYAEGVDGLTEHLSKKYGIDFTNYFLFNYTEWQSFVRFPKDMEGQKLFNFEPPQGYQSPTTFMQQVKSVLGLGVYSKNWDVELTEAVSAKLTNTSG